MNPQMMFLANFLSFMSNLVSQTGTPYQIMMNSQPDQAPYQLAVETINKIHRSMEIVITELENKVNSKEKEAILSIVSGVDR